MCLYSVGNSSWTFINKFETMLLLLKYNIRYCNCTDIMFILLLLLFAWHHAIAYAFFIYIYVYLNSCHEWKTWNIDYAKTLQRFWCRFVFPFIFCFYAFSFTLRFYRSMSFNKICSSNFHITLLFSAGWFLHHSRQISCTANGIFNANTILKFI